MVSSPATQGVLRSPRPAPRVAPAAPGALQDVLTCLAQGDDVAADVAARYALHLGVAPLDVALVVLDELDRLRRTGAGLLATCDADVRARRLFVRLTGPQTRRGRRVLLFADRHEAMTVAFGMVLEEAGARVSTVVSADPSDVLHLAHEQPWDQVVVDHACLHRSARAACEVLAPLLGGERAHVVVTGALPAGAGLLERGVTWVARDLRQMVAACGVVAADPLTEREREVLGAVAAGRSNEQIGRQLQLSLSTVKTYLERIHGKLGSVDRASAVATAVRGGWI